MGELSNKAKFYIVGIALLGLGIFFWQVRFLEIENSWLFVPITILGCLGQVKKVSGSTVKSSYAPNWVVYGFSILHLGLPATLLIMLVAHIVDCIVHKYPYYIPPFNFANFVIAAFSCAFSYELVQSIGLLQEVTDVLAIVVAMAVFTLVNHFIIGLVLNFARGQNFSESGAFASFPLVMDFTLLSLGGLASMLLASNPYLTLVLLFPLYMIYKALKMPALERETQLDAKTGLINTRYFNENLERELERANRFDRPITVVMADLDYLRNINNNYGHIAGDEVLIGIAEILKSSFRGYDTVARFGGEEFSILVPEAAPEKVFPRIDEIRQTIEDAKFEISTSTDPISVTMSFGISGRVEGTISPTEIIHNADLALYHAKANGRNRAYIYSDDFAEKVFSEEEKVKAGHSDVLVKPDPIRDEGQQPQNLEVMKDVPVDELPRTIGTELEQENIEILEQTEEIKEILKAGPINLEEKPPVAVIKSRPGWMLNAYITVLSLVSLGLMGFMIRYDPGLDWFGLFLFAILTGITEWFAVEVYDNNTSVSTSAAPFIGGLLLFGPVAAPVLGGVIVLAGLGHHMKEVKRIIFNFNATTASGLAVAGIAYLIGLPIIDQPIHIQFMMAVAAGLINYFLSTCAVGYAIALDTGQNFKAVWNEKFRWMAPFYTAFGVVGFLFILAFHFAGYLGSVAVIVPLLILRVSQFQFVERTKSVVNQIRSTNVALRTQADEITIINEELLLMLAGVSDLRDPYVVGHSQHVSRYAVLIAEELGLSDERVDRVRKAGLLHDIGKLGIAESILFKPGPLTTDEYESVKEHVKLGADILNLCHSLRDLIPFILHHHERFDGRGYPDGIKGGEVPLEARILGLADAVEAMASDRHYQDAMDPQAILEEVEKQAGSQFDPNVAKAFVRVVEKAGYSVIINSARRVEASASSQVRIFPELAVPVSEHVKTPWKAPDYY